MYYRAFFYVVQYSSMKRKQLHRSKQSDTWLPIDSRLIPPLFSFGHVHGVAKVFLTVEMVLAFGVVVGTLFMIVIHYFV